MRYLRYFLIIISLMFLPSCGSSSGSSGGGDLSCAPSSPSTPTVDLSTAELGQWTLNLTQTSSTCDFPPSSITCLLDMSVSGNDVTISGTCTSVASVSVTVTFDNTTGIVSGSTLYWGATMQGTAGTYTETATVSCTDVTFTSNTQSETFSVTANVSWSDSGDSGTCSTTFSGSFN